MNEILRNGIRSGIIIGVVIIFFVLIGFTVPMSEIFGNLFNIDTELASGNFLGLVIFFGLIGLGGKAKIRDMC